MEPLFETVGYFHSPIEAELARLKLAGFEIEAHVLDGDSGLSFGGWDSRKDGVRLQVLAEDSERALGVLKVAPNEG